MSVSMIDPETDIIDQLLDPEADVMGERTYIRFFVFCNFLIPSAKVLYVHRHYVLNKTLCAAVASI